eukprot:EG_transcript_19643
MKVFLDIAVGDVAEYDAALAEYGRAERFLAEKGAVFGLPASCHGLTAEDVATLQDAYAADPAFASLGPMRVVPPPDVHAGRLIVELFVDQCPKTCENFRQLCTGEAGKGKESGKPLHYEGCRFHRSVRGALLQGGDITRNDGSGGDSIYKGKFNDEKNGLKLKHDQAGLISMANSGKNTNTSQFFITLKPLLQLDGKHVVFGRVLPEGLEVLAKMDAVAHEKDGPPRQLITVVRCGVA